MNRKKNLKRKRHDSSLPSSSSSSIFTSKSKSKKKRIISEHLNNSEDNDSSDQSDVSEKSQYFSNLRDQLAQRDEENNIDNDHDYQLNGGDNGGEDIEEEEWKSVPYKEGIFKYLSNDDLREEDQFNPITLSGYTGKNYPVLNEQELNDLNSILNKGLRNGNLDQCIGKVHHKFQNLRKQLNKLVKKNKNYDELPEWTEKSIGKYLLQQNGTPIIFCLSEILKTRQINDQYLLNHFMEQKNDGSIKFNGNVLRLYRDTSSRMIKDLLSVFSKFSPKTMGVPKGDRSENLLNNYNILKMQNVKLYNNRKAKLQ